MTLSDAEQMTLFDAEQMTLSDAEQMTLSDAFCSHGCHDRDIPATSRHRLVGLVVKASASRAEDPEFESRLRRDFSGSIHTSDLKIGTPVATLQGVWRYRVSTGTGRPGVRCDWVR